MNNLQTFIKNYLEYCAQQKRLDVKTLKAYRIDLGQFSEDIAIKNICDITSDYPSVITISFIKIDIILPISIVVLIASLSL